MVSSPKKKDVLEAWAKARAAGQRQDDFAHQQHVSPRTLRYWSQTNRISTHEVDVARLQEDIASIELRVQRLLDIVRRAGDGSADLVGQRRQESFAGAGRKLIHFAARKLIHPRGRFQLVGQ
jgi:hypothetical protein